MTRQSGGDNRNRPKGNPNQDVQPWLGWIAAFLVVVIVVVAVALGMERTNMQRTGSPEVRMTPLVGGMQMPVATEAAVSVVTSEITPSPADTATGNVTDTDVITMVAVIPDVTDTLTDTETLTVTAGVSESEVATETTASTTGSTGATDEVSSSDVVSESNGVEEGEGTEAIATVEATPRARPTPRSSPTPAPPAEQSVFVPGDLLIADATSVAIHADAASESLVLNSFGLGFVVEVIEPSGDYAEYPVLVDGYGWVRVRAADGLVGWVRTDQVEAQ